MARQFNGTSDLITADAAHIFGNAVAFSQSAWVKAAASVDRTIYAEAATASINNVYLMATDTSPATGTTCRIFIKSSAGTTLLDVHSTAVVFDSTWHHCCFTQDASRVYALYVDGVLDKSGTWTSGTVTPTDCLIGALKRTTTTNFFSGAIGDVATWARQLSAAEAALLAAGVPASELGPTHYWPLWGTDSPEPDIGNG